MTQADYRRLVKRRHFTKHFLPHAQIIRKKHLINCLNAQMPLLVVEDFHAEQPAAQSLPREMVRHNSLHRHSTLNFSLGRSRPKQGRPRADRQRAPPESRSRARSCPRSPTSTSSTSSAAKSGSTK